MADVQVVQFAGHAIVRIDVSGAASTEDMIATFARAKEIITASPPKSVRALTNVSDCHFNKATVDGLADLARHATPHIVASAGVGVTGLKEVVARGLFTLIGRKVALFPDEASALEWLSRQ